MNRDTVIASVIGFGLGLVAAIALWVVPKMLPKADDSPKVTQQETKAEVAGKTSDTSVFSISTPQDGSITDKKSVNVAGLANDAHLVVVSTASQSAVITPSANGEFKADIDLTEGVNEIIVTKYAKDQDEQQKVMVYYSTESI